MTFRFPSILFEFYFYLQRKLTYRNGLYIFSCRFASDSACFDLCDQNSRKVIRNDFFVLFFGIMRRFGVFFFFFFLVSLFSLFLFGLFGLLLFICLVVCARVIDLVHGYMGMSFVGPRGPDTGDAACAARLSRRIHRSTRKAKMVEQTPKPRRTKLIKLFVRIHQRANGVAGCSEDCNNRRAFKFEFQSSLITFYGGTRTHVSVDV